eukprot:TRINITY_DN12687_c0_g2_i1.p1 TRINITY_DN12687_c0_g2~~TRINITY_DN12687_c0_g2_i1.p1  ORF type:complete len:213 (-),score=36.31 TRINITY_DN12687_c0_g2_i1:172-765(-)
MCIRDRSKEDLLSQLNYLKSRLSYSECDNISNTLKVNPVFENKAKCKFARNDNKVNSPEANHKGKAKIDIPDERYHKNKLDTEEDKSHPKFSDIQPARHERRPRTISSEYDSKGKEEPVKALERFETYDWFAEHKPDILFSTPLKAHFTNPRKMPYTHLNHTQSTPHAGKPNLAKRLAGAYPAVDLKESWNKGYVYL